MIRLPFNVADRSSLARKLITATIASAGVRIAGMVLTFLVGVQLAHYLGPAGYGVYGTVMAFAALLLVPAQFGLPQLITRDIPIAIAKREFAKLKGMIVWFTLAVASAALGMVVAGFTGLHLFSGERGMGFAGAIYWGLILIPLLALSNLAAGALRGLHHVVGAQLYEALLRPGLFAVLLLLAGTYAGDLDASSALSFQVAATAMALVLCAWHVRCELPHEVRTATEAIRPIGCMASLLPLTATEVLRTLEGHYSVLLLGVLASIENVGIFRVALSAAGLLVLPASLINLVVMPHVAQLNADRDLARLQLLATGSALAMLACTLAMTAVIYLFGSSLVVFVFGEAFRSAWPVLMAIAVAFSVNAFFGSSAAILNMSGQERSVALAHAAGLAVGSGLTWVLIGRLGGVGAGLAMIASEVVKGAILWYAAARYMNLDIAATSVVRLALSARRAARGSPPSARRD